MPSRGKTTVEFNEAFFDTIMKSAGVDELAKQKADEALKVAQSTAPVDTGDYKKRLRVERHDADYRFSWRVVGNDWKTLLIEAKTGNLARALKKVRGR